MATSPLRVPAAYAGHAYLNSEALVRRRPWPALRPKVNSGCPPRSVAHAMF